MTKSEDLRIFVYYTKIPSILSKKNKENLYKKKTKKRKKQIIHTLYSQNQALVMILIPAEIARFYPDDLPTGDRLADSRVISRESRMPIVSIINCKMLECVLLKSLTHFCL